MKSSLRLQDILFALLALALVALLAFHLGVIVLAMVGAFACGSVYLVAGMLPSRDESLGQRIFISVFLSIVLSSLVLILPGAIGSPSPAVRKPVIVIAGLIPLLAICFEVVRTPRVIRGILRYLGPR